MIVLDTNVVSELMRPDPHGGVATWVRAQSPDALFMSAISLAEIGYGITRLPDGRRKEALADAADDVFGRFSDHILAFDAAAAWLYPAIVGERDRCGSPINGFDAQIAAICRARDATLATRNVKDFARTGIDVTNPWTPRAGGTRSSAH